MCRALTNGYEHTREKGNIQQQQDSASERDIRHSGLERAHRKSPSECCEVKSLGWLFQISTKFQPYRLFDFGLCSIVKIDGSFTSTKPPRENTRNVRANREKRSSISANWSEVIGLYRKREGVRRMHQHGIAKVTRWIIPTVSRLLRSSSGSLLYGAKLL
jgi:hypothetical protein